MDGRELRVHKRHADGSLAWSYSGTLIEEGPAHICLSAIFGIDDRDDGYFVWQRGDRFLEWYYRDRWYNVFQIFDRDSGALRGWYCNVTRPAVWTADEVFWEDLALDVFIAPDGAALVLDRADFEALALDPAERAQGEAAVADIRARANAGEAPFTR